MSVVLNVFKSKKYVTSHLNQNTTARSKSRENCHSKLYTTEGNNSFIDLYKGIKIDINWSLLPSGRNWQPNTFSAAHRYLKYLIIKNIKKPSSTSLVTCCLNGHHIPNQKLSPLSFLSQRTANHSQPSSITIGTQLPVSRLSTIWPSKPLSAYTKSSSVHNYLIDSTKTYCLSQHNS